MAARWARIAPWELAAAPKGWRDMILASAHAETLIRAQRERGG